MAERPDPAAVRLVTRAVMARCIDLAFAVREVLAAGALSEVREDFAASLAFRTVSEVLMRHWSWDFAVYTFLAGMLRGGAFVDAGAFVARMADVPKDEAHLTSLFFGLLHEFGHSAPAKLTDRFGPPDYLADDTIIEWLDGILAEELPVPTACA